MNRYMEEKIDHLKSQRLFDLSTTIGICQFCTYLVGELHLVDVKFEKSSIKVIVKCRTLEILEDLWHDYCSGHLNKVAEKCLITKKVKKELWMETIKLKTTILEEDYVTCRLYLMEITGIFQLLKLASSFKCFFLFCYICLLFCHIVPIKLCQSILITFRNSECGNFSRHCFYTCSLSLHQNC